MRIWLAFLLAVSLLLASGLLRAAEEPDPGEDDAEPAEPVEEPAELVEEPAAPASAPAEPAGVPAEPASAPAVERPHKLISVLVLDTLDRGAGAEKTATAQTALKRALNGLDHVEVLGPRGLVRIQGAMPTEVQVQLARADNLVRKGREDMFNLAIEEAVESFQSSRVVLRKYLKWMDDPDRMITSLMGLAEALAAADDRDSAGMAYREVLVLSPDYEPDPGQVPTKLRSLFEQVRSEVSKELAGQLSVEVEPRGAKVVLDGLTVGQTPLVKGDIPPGLHMVRVERSGFTSLRQVVVVAGGETARIEGRLAAQRIPGLIRELRASLARPGTREEAAGLGRSLAKQAGLPAVLASQLIAADGQGEPVLSVAVMPAEGKPSVVAARLPAEGTGLLDQVVGALSWQIADALEEGSPPVPPPASLGLDFEKHLLGQPRTKVVSVVRIQPGTDTRPGDEAYPGPAGPGGPGGGGALPGGDPPPPPPPAGTPWWQTWWFWTGVGAVVAGSVATSLALTLEPKQKTIYEADQIRIRVIRNPEP